MLFTKALLFGASLVASVVAQSSSSSQIAFTVLPSSIQAGKDVTLHWGGGDSSPVTLTLQQGTTKDLKTVMLVAGDVTGDSYTWKVPTDLPNGTNYALRIQQGDSVPNYTGMITLTGGSGSSSAASSSAASSSTSGAVAGGAVAGGSSSSGNGTTIVTRPSSTMNGTNSTMNSTMIPTMVGTAGSSAGTGTTMDRNMTFSTATLTGSGAASSNVGGSGGAPTTSASATTTGSSTAPSKTGGAVTLVASQFGLVVCAVAGIVLLG